MTGVYLDEENEVSMELVSTGRSTSTSICRSISTESKGNEDNIDQSAAPVEVIASVELTKKSRKGMLQKQNDTDDKRIVVALQGRKVAKQTTTEKKESTEAVITTKCTSKNMTNTCQGEESSKSVDEELDTDVDYISDPNEERSYIVVDDVEDSENTLIKDVSSKNGLGNVSTDDLSKLEMESEKKVTDLLHKTVRTQKDANLLDIKEEATCQQTSDTIREDRSIDSNMVSEQQNLVSQIKEFADSTERVCVAYSNQTGKVIDQDHMKELPNHDLAENISDELSQRKTETDAEVKTDARRKPKK